MIKSLALCNFQSHADSKLNFVPGVNVIIGRSDSGKTALLRAIRWVTTNRPTGDAFRSEWGGDTSVELEVDSGSVRRIRTTSKNLYKLGSQELEAIGTAVPEEVSNLLNLDPSINLQSQFESPFLLDSTPGEVSRVLNRVAQLSIIDSARKNVEKWLRETDTSLRYKTAEMAGVEEELVKYAFLPKAQAEVEVLEDLNSHASSKRAARARLQKLTSNLTRVSEQISIVEDLLEAEEDVAAASALLEQKIELERKDASLRKVTSDYVSVIMSMAKLREVLRAEKEVEQASTLLTVLKMKRNEVRELRDQVMKLRGTSSALHVEQEDLEDLEEQFTEEMPEVCPLCGGRWST